MENRIYADAFGVIGSLTDIKVDFANTNPKLNEAGQVIGEEKIVEQRVILSIPLAKSLAKLLTAAVADYEAKFGPVVDIELLKETAGQG